MIALCAFAFVFLFPLLWEADATFRPAIEIFNTPPQLIQNGFASFASYTLDNVADSLIKWNAGLAFLNSVIITLGGGSD
jgi:ABC-type glycerol-3-phosphate transport system permease component